MNFETIHTVSKSLEAGTITSIDLTEKLIKIIQDRNDAIGGYSDFLFATARCEASQSDSRFKAGQRKSPIDGVPIAVKDLIDTYPAHCKAGLDHLSNYVPEKDAPLIAKLRKAGAVILGVTETDPGAFSTDTAKVINPFAPDRIAGGSSGGSAAVVAAGMAFSALGTDTGGSIRIPASCCSVYGFKPTWGRIDMSGVRPLASSLDHVGPISRCVHDLELLQGIIDPDFEKLPVNKGEGPLKLGIAKSYSADAVQLVRTQLNNTFETLLAAGIELFEIDLPNPDEVLSFHMINLPKEAADYHLKHFPNEWKNYPPIARETIEIGKNAAERDLKQVSNLRTHVRKKVDEALESVDAIVLPTMPVEAPMRDKADFELDGQIYSRLATTIRYTSLFNQTGHPVVSMPAKMLDNDHTLSIQVVGKQNDDRNLLAICKRLELIFELDLNYTELLFKNLKAVEEKRQTLEAM